MINRLQKGIWILSISTPIWIGFSISWWISKKTWFPSLIALIVATILAVGVALIYKNVVKRLSTIHVNVKKVTQNDRPVIVFMISYLLPFGSIAFEKYNPMIFLGFAALVYLVMIFSNSLSTNPLFFLLGFHFYDIECENGVGNYLLMTKKTIRNKDEIIAVSRITEYFLIMQEGKEDV